MKNQVSNSHSRRDSDQTRRFQTYVLRNRRVRVPDGFMAVGMITGAHGLRGEVKVELHTDFPERFASGNKVYLGADLDEVAIVQARPHQNQMLVEFQDITDRNAANALRGLWVFIAEEQAHELEEDTYYVHDIVGLAVQTEDGQPVGAISDVMPTGANDVYIIAPVDESKREILIPATAEVVQKVDLAQGIMVITPLPGLLED